MEFVEWKKGSPLLEDSCGFHRTSVVYNGKQMYVAFIHIEQVEEALHKLANRFYERR